MLQSVNTDIADFFDRNAPIDVSVNYLTAIKNSERLRFHLFVQQTLKLDPPIQSFSFPLSRISVVSAYTGDNFYIITGDDIGSTYSENIIEKFKANHIVNEWIGCSANFSENAQKIKRIALSAISLRLPHIERTQKTLAKPATGFVIHNPLGWSSSREHMPPISYDITITESDKSWLEKIDHLLKAVGKPSRRLRKALEYFYLGWFLEANERIAFNFMALDAVFGHGPEPTAVKLKTGISSTLKQDFDDNRFDDIINLRNQFLHGGSPDIYDSSLFDCYLRTYKCDPIVDIEYLTASCLRRLVFGTDFEMQPNPHEAEIQNLKDRGLIPTLPSQQIIIHEI